MLLNWKFNHEAENILEACGFKSEKEIIDLLEKEGDGFYVAAALLMFNEIKRAATENLLINFLLLLLVEEEDCVSKLIERLAKALKENLSKEEVKTIVAKLAFERFNRELMTEIHKLLKEN